jgi:hypothetical protein
LVHLVDSFAVDTAADTLVHFDNLNSPGSGITTIGSLGADFDDPGGIDIDDSTGNSFAAMLRHGESLSTFYAVNMQTGATTLIGPIGGGLFVTAMAVQPPVQPLPEPSSILFCIAAFIGSRIGRRLQIDRH